MKKIIGYVLRIFVYCGLAIAILYIGDFLSLMDAARFAETGRLGIFGFLSDYPLAIFAIMLIVPFFIVSNMRLWKKFE